MVVNKTALVSFKMSIMAANLVMLTLVLAGCDNAAVESVAAPIIKPALTEIVAAQANDSLSFNGVVRAAERADLAFRVGGRLIDIQVQEGDQVKKGQVLASLDPRDASTALASAELELNNNQIEYARAKAIFEKTQAISKSDLDTITTRYNLAKNRVAEAKRQLEYTKLYAPFDGVIGRKLVDNHVQIQANAAVFTLHDLSDLEVVINIPHKVMLSGLNNTQASAELSAIPQQLFSLVLRTFATQADPISQTYPVVLGFADLKGFRVLPGMAVKVVPEDVQLNQSVTSVTVPLTALVPDNQGKQFVWLVDKDNKAQQRYVEVGELSNNRIVITRHLALGERVIIAGVASVKAGMQVRPYTDSQAGA